MKEDLYVSGNKIFNREDMIWYVGCAPEATMGVFRITPDHPFYEELLAHKDDRSIGTNCKDYELPEELKKEFEAIYESSKIKMFPKPNSHGSRPNIYKYKRMYFYGQTPLANYLNVTQPQITNLVRRGDVKLILNGTDEFKKLMEGGVKIHGKE